MGVFNAGPNVQTQDFRAGDVGYVPRNQGHYIQNTGTTDVQFLALFRAPVYEEISLSEWLVRTPPALVAQHFNIDPSVLAKFPQDAPGILPV
jgi:oxalate decarboxylase